MSHKSNSGSPKWLSLLLFLRQRPNCATVYLAYGGETVSERKQVRSEIEVTLQVIGGKWKPLILHFLLHEGPKRYSEILRYLESAPKKTLTEQLRQLEADGVVAREVSPTIPIRVIYSMTAHGETLAPLLDVMCAWGFVNMDGRYEVTHPTCEDSPASLAKKQQRLVNLSAYLEAE